MSDSWKQHLYHLSRSNTPESFFQRAKLIVHLLQTNPEERQLFLEAVILETEEGVLLACAGYSSLLGYLHRRLGYINEYGADNIISTVIRFSEQRRDIKDEQMQTASCACFIAIMSALSSVNIESAEKCLRAYQTYYLKLFSPHARSHCQASLSLSLVIIASSHLIHTLSVAQDLLIKPSDSMTGGKGLVNYLLFLLSAFGDKQIELAGPYVGPFSLPLLTENDIRDRKIPHNLLRQLEATLISDTSFWIYSCSQDIHPQKSQGKQNKKSQKAQKLIDPASNKDMHPHPVWKHLFAFYVMLYKTYGEDGIEAAVTIQTHLVKSLNTPTKNYNQEMCYILEYVFSAAEQIVEYKILFPKILCAGNFLTNYVLPNESQEVCSRLLRCISKWCYDDISKGREFAVSLNLDAQTIYSIINTDFGKLVFKRAPEQTVSKLLTYMGTQLQRCLSMPLVPEKLELFLNHFSIAIKIHSISFPVFSAEFSSIFHKFFSLFYYQIKDHSLVKQPTNTDESFAILRKGRQQLLMALEPLATADMFIQLIAAVLPSVHTSFKYEITGAQNDKLAKLHYPILLQTASTALSYIDELKDADNDYSATFIRHYGAVAIAAFCFLLMGPDDEQVLPQSTAVQNILASIHKASKKQDEALHSLELETIQVALVKFNFHFHSSNTTFGRIASVAIMERVAADLKDRAFSILLTSIQIALPRHLQIGADDLINDDSAEDELRSDTEAQGRKPLEHSTSLAITSESEPSNDEVSSVHKAEHQYDRMLVETFRAHRAVQEESVNVFMRAGRALYPLAVAMDTIPDRPANWDALEALYILVSSPLGSTKDEHGFQHSTVKYTPMNRQYVELMVHRASELITSYTRSRIVRSELSVSDLFVCYAASELDNSKEYELVFRWKEFTESLIPASIDVNSQGWQQAEEILAFVVSLLNSAKDETFFGLAEEVHTQCNMPIQKIVSQCLSLCKNTARDLVDLTIKKMVRNRDLDASSHVLKRFIEAECYFTLSFMTTQFVKDTFISLFVAERFILLMSDALANLCNGVKLKRIAVDEDTQQQVSKLLLSMLEWLAKKNSEAERSQQLKKLKFSADRIKKIAIMSKGIVDVDDSLKTLNDTRQKIAVGREAMRARDIKR